MKPHATRNGGSTGRGAAADAAAEREPFVVADAEDLPSALAIDERYVYWTTSSALRRAPLAGGAAQTLATSSALGMIAVARGSVFFTDPGAGTVSMVDREGGPVTVIGRGEAPFGIAVHGDSVYWTNRGGSLRDGSIAKVRADGTPATILAMGLTQPSGLAADSGFVYFTSGAELCPSNADLQSTCVTGVLRVPIGGGFTLQLDSRDAPTAVALSPRGGAYWMRNEPPQVMFAPADGSQARKLANAPEDEAGPLAVDEEAFYWGSGQRGRVMKVSLEGGEPQPVASELGTIGGIAVDRDWLYVSATSQGRVVRVAKGGWASAPSGPITGPCPTPLGGAAEIAATPRADGNLELLALQLDPSSLTVPQETYDRVLADVAAIRAAMPALADVAHFSKTDGKQLSLFPNADTLRRIEAGEYSAWDCLNEFYGLESLALQRVEAGSSFVLVQLKGLYALDRIAEVYEQLPGIEAVSTNVSNGDGPTICASRSGANVIEYVIDRASGDCPVSCNIHDAHHFASTAAGVIVADGSWQSEAGVPPPEWFARVCKR